MDISSYKNVACAILFPFEANLLVDSWNEVLVTGYRYDTLNIIIVLRYCAYALTF